MKCRAKVEERTEREFTARRRADIPKMLLEQQIRWSENKKERAETYMNDKGKDDNAG
jgi:hypothetical protein